MSIAKIKQYLAKEDLESVLNELDKDKMSFDNIIFYLNRNQQRRFFSQTKFFNKLIDSGLLTDKCCLNFLKTTKNNGLLSLQKILSNEALTTLLVRNFIFDRIEWLDSLINKEYLSQEKTFVEYLKSHAKQFRYTAENLLLIETYDDIRKFEQFNFNEKRELLHETISSQSSSILKSIVENNLQDTYSFEQIMNMLSKDSKKKKIKLNL